MDGLNTEQTKRLSEILGNIAVAWFTVGVISPLFTGPKDPLDKITPFIVGLAMTLIFTTLSLQALKEIA